MTARELVEAGYGNAEILINGIPLEEYQLTCAEEVVDYILVCQVKCNAL